MLEFVNIPLWPVALAAGFPLSGANHMDAAPQKPTAIAYARFSPKPDASEAQSIEHQKEKINAYAAFAGLDVIRTIEDPEVSGRSKLIEREGGGVLWSLVGKHKVVNVIAYRLDRIFRSVEDGLPIMKRWQRQGVRLHLVAEGGCSLNTSTAWGRMMVAQRLMLAEFEADLTAERTADSMRQQQANGLLMGKIPPYGWTVDPEWQAPADQNSRKKKRIPLVEVAEERSLIERIMMMRSLGFGARAICRTLNNEGLTHRGSEWQHCQVFRIEKREKRAAGVA
jgi:site-specific DNA recombinase